MSIFCQKMSVLSKTPCTHVIFSKFSWKTQAVMPKLGLKRQFYQNYTILLAKKVKKIPFFPIFKNICFHAHILLKKRPFTKIACCSGPYFVKKTSMLLKARCSWCSHVIFSNFSRKTPCFQTHIWSKKHPILSNLHYNIISIKVNRMPLFI